MGRLGLLWKGLTRNSQTIVNLKECKGCCWDFGSISYRRSVIWTYLLSVRLASAASSELPVGTMQKVGQEQHMTAAHCCTTLKSNSLSMSFTLSHFVSFPLTHTKVVVYPKTLLWNFTLNVCFAVVLFLKGLIQKNWKDKFAQVKLV